MTTINKQKVWVYYSPNRLDSYTILLENGDVWGTGTVDTAPTGYAGNVLEKGYSSVKEYQADMELRSWIGRSINIEHTPDSIVEWIQEITQTNNYGKSNNSGVIQEVLRTKQE